MKQKEDDQKRAEASKQRREASQKEEDLISETASSKTYFEKSLHSIQAKIKILARLVEDCKVTVEDAEREGRMAAGATMNADGTLTNVPTAANGGMNADGTINTNRPGTTGGVCIGTACG